MHVSVFKKKVALLLFQFFNFIFFYKKAFCSKDNEIFFWSLFGKKKNSSKKKFSFLFYYDKKLIFFFFFNSFPINAILAFIIEFENLSFTIISNQSCAQLYFRGQYFHCRNHAQIHFTASNFSKKKIVPDKRS